MRVEEALRAASQKVRLTPDTTRRTPGGWRNAVLVALAVAAGLVLTRIASCDRPAIEPLVRIDRLQNLPVAGTHSIELDVGRSLLRVTGLDPYIVLPPDIASQAIRAVRLRVRPTQLPANRVFDVYFVPAQEAGASFSEGWRTTGEVAVTADWWVVRWPLPSAASQTRLDFPEGGEYEFGELALSNDRAFGRPATGGVLRNLLVLCAGWVLVLFAIQRAMGRWIVPAEASIKQVLLLSLMLPLSIMTFLLPPFQGPDEDGAWKLALVHYRPSIREEPALFYLPDLMNAEPVKFRPTVHQSSDRLRWSGFDTPPPPERLDAEYQTIQGAYKYGRWYAYPAVWLVGLFYPKVGNVQQALVFFYLCRLATGLMLVAALETFRRRFDLPFVAIAFFALPAVVQQFVIVSVDTVLHVGTIAAVLLFLRCIDRRSIRWATALLMLVTALTLVKFTFAGLLLLPIALLIRRGLRVRPTVMVASAVIAVVAGVIALRIVLALARDQAGYVGNVAGFDAQVVALTTWEGWRAFLSAYWRVLKGAANPAVWAGPLGWLDTTISPQHLTLITGSLGAAFALDLWRYWRPLVDAWRARRRDIVMTAGVIAGAFVVASFVNSLVFYVITTPVGARFVAGTQGRHLFYAGIVGVLLPAWIVRNGEAKTEAGTAWRTTALVLLGLLLAARSVELAIDLLTRYW